MKHIQRIVLLLVLCCSTAIPAFSQMAFSIGPQAALPLGLGVGATLRVAPKISVAAEVNYAPLFSVDYEGQEGTYDGDISWLNANVTAQYHPNPEGRFAFMGGLYLGGLQYDLTMQESTGEDLSAEITLGGPSLLLGLGWFGKGLTGTFGVAFPASIRASADDASIEEDVEQGSVEDIPTLALPYIKLGYQFGW